MNSAAKLPTMLVDRAKAPQEWLDQIKKTLAAVDAGQFPNSLKQFTPDLIRALRNDTPEGRRICQRWHIWSATKDALPAGYSGKTWCPDLQFLILLQAERATYDARRWREWQSLLHPPELDQACRELVPSKAAALFAEADRKRDAAIREKTDHLSAFRSLMGQWKPSITRLTRKQRQKAANQKQDATPPRPTVCDWSGHMSVRDYSIATGHNRKTISDWLNDLNARVSRKGKHAADPDRYGPSVNLKILSRWIAGWRDAAQACDLAAETAAFAFTRDPKFSVLIFNTIGPVLDQRGLLNENFHAAFGRALVYYAPPPPAVP